jgi:nicotinamidase-related amidase
VGDFLPLPPNARTALLIVDMQVFFFTRSERRIGLDAVVANINRLIEKFDAAGDPVVHIISEYHPDGSDWDLKMRMKGVPELIEDSPESQILKEIMVNRGHHIVPKTRYSGFFHTGLSVLLNSMDVNRVFVTGGYTHYCVNATVFDAYAHDFVPGVVTDAVISHLKVESDLMIVRMRRNGYHVMTTQEVIDEWRS